MDRNCLNCSYKIQSQKTVKCYHNISLKISADTVCDRFTPDKKPIENFRSVDVEVLTGEGYKKIGSYTEKQNGVDLRLAKVKKLCYSNCECYVCTARRNMAILNRLNDIDWHLAV